MRFAVYINDVRHGCVESDVSTDDRVMIHIPEELCQVIGNKYFHVDLVEVK